jgi:DNA-binding response OmpR family regulator
MRVSGTGITGKMSSSATIVFARKDLSIPGAAENPLGSPGQSEAVEARFFQLVADAKPDVIVLACAGAPSAATETVQTVRRRTDIPIIVLCEPEKALVEQYRRAGAADCVPFPVDLAVLGGCVHKVIGDRRHPASAAAGRR